MQSRLDLIKNFVNLVLQNQNDEAMAVLYAIKESGDVGEYVSDSFFVPVKIRGHQCSMPLIMLMSYLNKNAFLRVLLDIGMSANTVLSCPTNVDIDKYSALMLACENDDMEAITLLLDHQADFFHQNEVGLTALMQANSEKTSQFLVKYAIQKNCLLEYISLKNKDGVPAFHYLVDKGFTETGSMIFVELLVQLGYLMKNATDDILVDYIEKMEKLLGIETVSGIIENFYGADINSTQNFNFLSIAAQYNHVKTFAKVVSFGFDINESVTDKTDPQIDHASPLMFACFYNSIDVVRFSMKQPAVNLLHLSASKNCVLFYVRSAEICRVILKEAANRGCLNELLQMKNIDDQTGLDYACLHGLIDVASEIMKVDNVENIICAKSALHMLRTAYWAFPDKSQQFDALCINLRKKMKIKSDALQFPTNTSEHKPELSYLTLFNANNTFSFYSPQNKEQALDRAVAQLNSLLKSPLKCIPYLQSINDEFVEYYKLTYKEDTPTVDPSSYTFEIINGLYYPIPHSQYQKQDKHHAIKKFLIQFLQHFGLAERSYTWIGYIPKVVANDLVSDGAFVKESPYGDGLFHNTLTHMLQGAIMCSAMKDKTISTSYPGQEKMNEITSKDILHHLVSKNASNSQKALWMNVKDTRGLNSIYFSDPHRLGSVIMHSGSSFGLSALSNYLIDTFCYGFTRLLDCYQKQPAFQHLTPQDFAKKMDDMELRLFSAPAYIYQHAIGRENQEDIIDQSTKHAVVKWRR